MTSRTLIAAILLACLAGSIAAQSPDPVDEQPANQTPRSADDQSGSDQQAAQAIVLANNRQADPSPTDVAAQAEASDSKQADDDQAVAIGKADLVQQTRMANYTFWIMWASAAGVAISGLGVGLLVRSLNEARKASVAARDSVNALMRAERATLSIQVAKLSEGAPAAGWRYLRIHLTIRNSGRTAALNASIEYSLVIRGFGQMNMGRGDLASADQQYASFAIPSPYAPGDATFDILYRVPFQNWEPIRESRHYAYVIGQLVYQDVFSEDQRRSRFGFAYLPATGGTHLVRLESPSFWESN